MATALSNLTGASASHAFSQQTKRLLKRKSAKMPPTVLLISSKSTQAASESDGSGTRTGRRAAIGLVLAGLVYQQPSHAEEENNGLWLTGPLPVPKVTNIQIANVETGTRSFIRDGIYMANIGSQGSAYRLRMYAFDLLALGDLLGQDAWSLVRKYLCLKSTVMYFDFDKVITAAPVEQQQPLIALANRLFDSIEKLEEAVKQRSEPTTQSCYEDTTAILKEVMTRMA